MPAFGAIASFVMTTAIPAISSIGLAGLAQGAMIVGTGMSVIGGITGNKTLTKIGAGVALAGGIGSIANGMRGVSVMSGTEKGLLAADGIETALSAPTKGSGLKTFAPIDASRPLPVDAFNNSSAGLGFDGKFDPEFEKSYFQRANDTLTKYNTALNIAGGMGQAYMQGEQMDLQKDLLDKRLDFEQQLVDRVNTNNGTVLQGINPSISAANTGRNSTAYSGMLRGA